MNAAFLFICILTFCYAYLSIVFSTKILQTERISLPKHIIYSMICGGLSAVTLTYFPIYLSYLFIGFFIYLAHIQIWHIRYTHSLFLTFAYMLNILSFRMLVTTFMAFFTNISIYEILNNQSDFSNTTIIISCFMLVAFLILSLKYIPADKIHLVQSEPNLRTGMNFWMGLCSIYLLIQFQFLGSREFDSIILLQNQFLSCNLLLFANWAFLFYNMRIASLLKLEVENKRLQHEVEFDIHTGVFNKKTFQQKLELNINKGGVLYIIDLDDFKMINDKFGHAVGDEVLLNIVRLLKKTFREDEIIGRFGGDEFLVFISEQNFSYLTAIEKGKSMCHLCKNYSDNHIKKGNLSISIGGILFRENEFETFKELFPYADQALYESKKNGKNCCTIIQK